MERLGILSLMAFRSLGGHKIKGLIVGSLLAFGTFLFVIGTTMLENVERAMEASITQSITGHVQLVSTEGEDRLVFFGPEASSEQDIGVLEDFERIREVAEGVPGVNSIVPMGRYFGQPILNTEVDDAIDSLEEAFGLGDEALIEERIAMVRRMLGILQEEFERVAAIAEDGEELEASRADLKRALSDAFWEEIREAPEEGIEFLSFRVAQLSDDQSTIYLPFIGTDLHRYAESFVHFEMVEGEMPPPGARGILVSQAAYDEFFKNRAARTLDRIHEAKTLDGRTIDEDPALQDLVSQLRELVPQVTMHLSPAEARALEKELRERLGAEAEDLDALLEDFFALTDENIQERHAFFYESIAPKIPLYRVAIGDRFILRSMTKSGYPKAVEIKLWGTFRFKSLERSVLASAYSLVDFASFRDLLGLMTAEKRRELDAIRDELTLAEVDAASAEDFFFGDSLVIEEVSVDEVVDLDDRLLALETADTAPSDRFDPETIEKGTILNAAVVLDDPRSTNATVERLNQAFQAAGLKVKAISWTEVTGIIGQLVLVFRAVLYILIGIIFIVALVIINNSMVMATMDRIGEIGTMRAIGAPRRFVLALFLLETLVLGLFASAAGAAGATALLAALGQSGIHTHQPFLIFLFGGTVLYPTLSLSNVLWGFAIIVFISLLSTLYPARLAARVAPVVAMQGKE